jgi:hypothetical protein
MATVDPRTSDASASSPVTDWPDCWLCSRPFKDGERKMFIARVDIHVHPSCYDDDGNGHVADHEAMEQPQSR